MPQNEPRKFLPFLGVLALLAIPSLGRATADQASDDSDAPFKAGWEWDLGLTTSGQPADNGGGQVTQELSFKATDNLTPSGHFFSLGAIGGRQKMEGGNAGYGTFSLEGGLGLDFFFPVLFVQTQRGESALSGVTGGLDLGFQLSDQWSAGLSVNGGFSNHQGPVSQILGFGKLVVEVDSKSWGGGLSLSFVPWDFLTLTLAGQQSYNILYRIQNLAKTKNLEMNQTVRSPSLSLGADFTIAKDFTLTLTGQRGQEFYPAGRVYSPDQGRVLNLSVPTSQYFWGYGVGVGYHFE